ncbi:hypothetical protein GGI21_000365 [Coemansia aciculifera]|nr:hypothetical protein GGI21_000365 [Coemansia aciculifera]
MYGNITWQFYVCPSDIGYDNVSSDDNKDHDALTAKVPLSKIHGSELIGLSPHPPTLSESTSSGIGPRTICCTGFGSNQVPIPIFSEPKPKAAVEAPTVAAAAAPTVVVASASVSVTSTTTAPSVFTITKTSESAEPDSAGKSETEEMAAPAATPVPLFIFGKPAADEASEKLAAIATEKTATDATDDSSKVATALMMPMLSPASVSAANNTLSVKGLDVTHHMSMTSAHVFSVQPATLTTTNAMGTATGTVMPELALKAVISVLTFSFGLSKPAADSASKPAATSGLFSFGAAAATLNATTMSAVIAGDKPKSEFKFSFGSLGTALTAGTQATSAAAGQLAQQMTFGQICVGASAASCKAPIILTAKWPRNDIASSSDVPAASKPKFNFGLSSATGSRFSLASSASSAPVFGSQSFNFTANPAFTSPTVNSTMPASSKPIGTFTFGSTAMSATAPSGTGGGAGFTFTFGYGSTPHIQPVLMATTCLPSNGFGSTPAASSFGGTTNNVLATSTSDFNFGSPFGGLGAAKPTAMPALTAFGGFGKGMMTLTPGTAAKMLVFSFDPAMQSASGFGSGPVIWPTTTPFANPAASATTPACGPAMPSAPSFGSGPVVWPTTSPFANPAASATTPACGPATLSAPSFGSGPVIWSTTSPFANPAASATTPACGPATLSAPSFGSGPVIWSTTSPFANPAASATTPACGPAMPSAPSFGSGPVIWPTTSPFANPAALATTPACGAATPSASGFGSGPVAWPTTSPFANSATSATTPACGAATLLAPSFGSSPVASLTAPAAPIFTRPATLATTPACGPATSSAPHFSFGPITLLTTMNIANLPVFFHKPTAATPKPLKSILCSNAPSFKPKKAVHFVSHNPQADAGVGCS